MHVMQVAGAEVLVTQIIQRLKHFIEPTVFCLDALGYLGEQLREQGVPVIVLDRKPGLDLHIAKRLAVEVRSRRIQLLHAHQYTPFFYAALARLRYRAPAKILFTEHGRHYPDIVSWKRRWVNRLLLQHYAEIATACCDFSTQALREVEGFSHAVTLANGVDLSQLPARGNEEVQQRLREQLGLRADTPYVACIARFHPVKDHAMLLRAWQRVVHELPSAQLLLVGEGPEKEARQQQARELGIAHAVQFWGIRHDVSDILRAVDLFALTSVSEAASLTLLEAMASQCASVITNVGGNAEHVREGIDGYLVPRGDADLLSQRLIELLNDPTLAHRMGLAARERVIRDFALSQVVQKYQQRYEELAGHGTL